MLVFFVSPIGASELTRGVSSSNLGTNPSTTPFFETGLHLSSSRWLYRTPPTLVGRLQLTPAWLSYQRQVAREHNRGAYDDSVRDHRVGHHIAVENHPLVWTEETRYYPMPIRVKGNKHHSPINQITRASYGPKN